MPTKNISMMLVLAVSMLAGKGNSQSPDSAGLQKDVYRVRVLPNEASRRVGVFIGAQLFTAYLFPETVKKPVLFPLRTAGGAVITRGYPLEPRPGERVDHPHQVGPLGQEVLSNGKEELNLKLEPRQSAVFRYRVLILSEVFSLQSIERQYQRFQSEVK